MDEGCCEDGCVCVANNRAKSAIFSCAAGGVFGLGWWLLIDAAVYSTYLRNAGKTQPFPFLFALPGIGVTLAFFCINAMDWRALNADECEYFFGRLAPTFSRRSWEEIDNQGPRSHVIALRVSSSGIHRCCHDFSIYSL